MLEDQLQQAVHRYLRGDMSEREEAEFEVLWLDRPDILEELELSSLMREGIAEDGSASEPAGSVPPAPRRLMARVELALAAALILLVGAGLVFKQGPIPTIDLVQQRSAVTTVPSYPLEDGTNAVRFRITVSDESASYTVRLQSGPDQVLQMERGQLRPDEYGDITVVVERDALDAAPLKIVALNESSNEAREFVFEVYLEQRP